MDNDWNALWNESCDALRQCGITLIQKAPADIDRAEALRYVSRLFGNAVTSHLEAKSVTAPVMRFGGARIGGDNPDYRYASAPLDGRSQYRLSGRINGAARIAFSTFSGAFGTSKRMMPTGAIDTDSADFPLGEDGSFDLILSSDEGAGSLLTMSEDTASLLIRELLLRPEDKPADYKLECISTATADEPMDAPQLKEGLRNGIAFVSNTVNRFIGWTEAFSSRPNQILPLPAELAGTAGDRTTKYYNGYFALPDAGHALLVTFQPPSCTYWNIQAVNHWLESLDTLGNRSHYNNATVATSPTGEVTVVFAAADPGVENWIDTTGHLHGGIVLRFIGTSEDQQVVPFTCKIRPLPQVPAGRTPVEITA